MDSNTKRLEILLHYNFVNEVTDEEEDVILVTELNLFAIGTITLPEPKIFTKVVVDAKTNRHAKIGIDAKTNINAKIGINTNIDIDEPIFDFPHTQGKILVNTMPIQIQG